MKHLAAIQSQLSTNKKIIKFIEDEIIYLRQRKAEADEKGYLTLEYSVHEIMKQHRAELKGYVKIQQALKQLCKGNV